ncbi:MAG TPA: DUF885 domain-containing protein, partial [Allosphingosinicella sp.]
MTRTLPLLALLLATACSTTTSQPVENITPGLPEIVPAAPDPAAEDARLLTFLDAAFEESIASSPQTLTALGRKEQYNRLNDYTDAASDRQLALAEAQLARMKAEFDPAKLSPAGRLSYQLF